MSRPIPARKQKRWLPPTPHVRVGAPAIRAEVLALDLGKNLAGIARSHLACRPSRKCFGDDTEYYAAMWRFQTEGVFTIADAVNIDFPHIEEAVVLGMLDAPELLRRQLNESGFAMVRSTIRMAEPELAAELKKGKVARVAAKVSLKGQGDLFAGLES